MNDKYKQGLNFFIASLLLAMALECIPIICFLSVMLALFSVASGFVSVSCFVLGYLDEK